MDHIPQHGPSPQETPRRTQQTTLPPKDSLREVGLVAAILLGLVLAIGGIWMYQEQTEEAATATRPTGAKRIAREARTVTAPAPLPPSGNFEVYFNVGQDSLTAKAKSVLAEQGAQIAGHKKVAVLLYGHTDRRGSTASNEALGQRRARAVEAELVKLGVPKTAIQVFSQGEHDALCRSKTEDCHRKNRRVHVSWNATPDLTSASAGPEPASRALREKPRLAGEDLPGPGTPERAPVRAAQATSK